MAYDTRRAQPQGCELKTAQQKERMQTTNNQCNNCNQKESTICSDCAIQFAIKNGYRKNIYAQDLSITGSIQTTTNSKTLYTESDFDTIKDRLFDMRIDQNQLYAITTEIEVFNISNVRLINQYRDKNNKGYPINNNYRIVADLKELNLKHRISYSQLNQRESDVFGANDDQKQVFYKMGIQRDSSWPIIAIICMNNLKFHKSTKAHRHVYFDIETKKDFTQSLDKSSSIPMREDPYSSIVMICATSVVDGQITSIDTWIFNQMNYQFELSDVVEQLRHNIHKQNELRLNKPQLLTIPLQTINTPKEFTNEQSMCLDFLNFLNDSQFITTGIAFNGVSSQITKNKKDGVKVKKIREPYDLPFILYRAGISTQNVLKSQVAGLNSEEAQYMIRSFNNVYFQDAKIVFNAIQKGLSMATRTEINGYSLDHYLEFFGIGNKQEHNYTIMNNSFLTPYHTISQYISYCIWDTTTIAQSYQLFQQIPLEIELMDKLEIPYSFVIAKKQTICITKYLLQQYINEDMSVHFGFMYTTNTNEFYGGRSETGSLSTIYKNIYLTELDYSGQYPSCACQFNMCHNTLSNADDQDSFKINIFEGVQAKDDKNNGLFDEQAIPIACKPKFVYFNKSKKSLYKTLLLQWINEKKQAKINKMQVREKMVKLLINSSFGLYGQSSNPLFSPNIGPAITAAGRQLIWTLIEKLQQNGYNCTMVETDAVYVQNSNNHAQDMIVFKQIAKEIKDQYEFMEVDVSDIHAEKYIIPKSKKAYISEHFSKGMGSFAQLSPEFRTTVKAFLQSLLQSETLNETIPKYTISRTMRKFNEKLIKQTLKDCQSYDIFNKVRDFCEDVASDIISARNVKDLKKYFITIKNGKHLNKEGEITRVGFLSDLYGESDQYTICPYNQNKKRKDYNWTIYSDDMNINKIKRFDMISIVLRNIKSFFQCDIGTVSSESNIEDDKFKGKVCVRKQKTNFWSKELIAYDMDILESLIKKYGDNTVYHEVVLTNRQNNAFFDIEGETHLSETIIYKILEKLGFRNYGVASCHKIVDNQIVKYSYHIVCQTVLPIQHNNIIAQYFNNELKHYNPNTKTLCDTQVYKSNASLRLPGCVKIKDGLVDNRRFEIIKGSFKDLIISYTKHSEVKDSGFTFETMQAFTRNEHKHYTKQSLDNLMEYLSKLEVTINKKTQALGPCSVDESGRICVHKKPYHCPCCKEIHESQDLQIVTTQKISCWARIASKDKQLRIPDNIALQVEFKELKGLLDLQNARIINKPAEKFIGQYNIHNSKLTFIRSAMGTGKTKSLLPQLQDFDYVVVISFRKTFSSDISHKWGITSYNETEGQRDLRKIKKIVIQIDSLSTLIGYLQCDNMVVVLDEVESILSQIEGFKQMNHVQKSIEVLIDLMKHANNVVIMDALLTLYTQKKIIQIMQSNTTDEVDYQAIQNNYRPKQDHTVDMIYDKNNKQYQKHIETLLQQGKRIYSHCTSHSAAEKLVESIKTKFPTKTIAYYHGKNTWYEESIDGTHLSLKDLHLSDVNTHWKDIDLLVYTSTLTAGVSFEQENFDLSINYWCKNTTTCVEFIQALGRIRNVKDKHLFVYYQQVNKKQGPSSSYQLFKQEYEFTQHQRELGSIVNQLVTYALPARKNNICINNVSLLKLFLDMQGYTVNNIKKSEVYTQIEEIKNSFEEQIPFVKNDMHSRYNQIYARLYPDEDSKTLQLTQLELNTIPDRNEKELSKLKGKDAKYAYLKQTMCNVSRMFNLTLEETNNIVHKPLICMNGTKETSLLAFFELNRMTITKQRIIHEFKQKSILSDDFTTMENVMAQYKDYLTSINKVIANDVKYSKFNEDNITKFTKAVILKQKVYQLSPDGIVKPEQDKELQNVYKSINIRPQDAKEILQFVDIDMDIAKSHHKRTTTFTQSSINFNSYLHLKANIHHGSVPGYIYQELEVMNE